MNEDREQDVAHVPASRKRRSGRASFAWTLGMVIVSSLVVTVALMVQRHLALVTSPWPQEFREGGMIVPTYLLLSGENVFAISSQPLATNVYGILYNLVALPISYLYGATLGVHRIVSGIFILLSSVVVVLWLRNLRTPWVAALAGGSVVYVSLLFFVTPLSRPDSLGVFLFLSSLYVPYRYRFRKAGLAAAVALGCLIYFTKAYFLVSGPILASYLFLFVSRKAGLVFGAAYATAISLVGLLSLVLLESYVNMVFGIHINVASRSRSHPHLVAQLENLARWYWPMLVLIGAVWSVRILFPRGSRGPWPSNRKQSPADAGVDPGPPGAPLLSARMSFEGFSLLWTSGLLFLVLGPHAGAVMTYFLQLFIPLLVIVAVRHSADVIPAQVVAAVFVANAALFLHERIPPAEDLAGDAGWAEVSKELSGRQKVYNSPAIVSLLLAQGKPIYNSGLSEYGADSGIHAKELAWLFRERNERLAERWAQHVSKIRTGLERCEFDLVMVTRGELGPGDQERLEATHTRRRTISVLMRHAQQKWDLEVWDPKCTDASGVPAGRRRAG